MSTPTTKRDQRRLTRREQFQQRQEERRRARERQRRIEQYRRVGIISGVVLVLGLVIWWGAASIIGGGKTSTVAFGPATGQDVDRISCTTGEQLTVHYHADLQIYVNGQLQAVPAGIGFVLPDSDTSTPHLASNGTTACVYSLHTHNADGIIHIESPDSRSYTLGNLFDIWGQHLSTRQFMNHAVDAKHKLVVLVYDSTGAKHVVTGDPSRVVLSAHETVVIQYNSASELGSPFTQWNGL
jgi:hypothetical protein